ncbi:hypothetical protein K503DRAFT_702362, partial [Rhizopogon vinicolor AM-OR11-026]
RFSQTGGLYIKEDVEPALQVRRLYAEGEDDDEASDRFRSGPYTDWMCDLPTVFSPSPCWVPPLITFVS